MFFFFFQAEDGIRDKLVTGVQTCALPISPADRRAKGRAELRMKQRGGVLVFTGLADDRGLPVGLGGGAEGLRGLLREQRPELLPRVDERREGLDELPGERILDDPDRRDLPHGTPRGPAAVGQDLASARDA